MLTGNQKDAIVQASTAPLSGSTATSATRAITNTRSVSHAFQARLARVLRIEWLGQTVASICWIGSVLAYGVNSSGDWLQLFAASSWLLANVAAAVTIKAD